jgi:hypothetical protein
MLVMTVSPTLTPSMAPSLLSSVIPTTAPSGTQAPTGKCPSNQKQKVYVRIHYLRHWVTTSQYHKWAHPFLGITDGHFSVSPCIRVSWSACRSPCTGAAFSGKCFKFRVLKLRTVGSAVQISEFQLLDSADNRIPGAGTALSAGTDARCARVVAREQGPG